jgi:hypothetical protein
MIWTHGAIVDPKTAMRTLDEIQEGLIQIQIAIEGVISMDDSK